MNDNLLNSIDLLSNFNIDSKNYLYYKKNQFGFLFNLFRSRERFYILYSFSYLIFLSFGLILFDFLLEFSLADKLSELFGFTFYVSLFLESLFLSIIIFLFSFTIYSSFINSISLIIFSTELGIHFISFLNDSLIISVLYFSLFSFAFIVFLGESLFFSRAVTKSGFSISRLSEIFSFSLFFVFYLIFIIVLFMVLFVF